MAFLIKSYQPESLNFFHHVPNWVRGIVSICSGFSLLDHSPSLMDGILQRHQKRLDSNSSSENKSSDGTCPAVVSFV